LGSTSPLARAICEVLAKRIIHQADWIMGQLSGRYDVTDENNALKSGYDPVTRQWPDWIAATGFDAKLFPAVVPAGTKVATIRPGDRRSIRSAARCRHRLRHHRWLRRLPRQRRNGTGRRRHLARHHAHLKLLSDKPVFAPDFGIYSHRIGDQWLAGGASNTGGAAIGQVLLEGRSRAPHAAARSRSRRRASTIIRYRNPASASRQRSQLPAAARTTSLGRPRLLPGHSRRHRSAIEAEAYAKLGELGASPLISIRTAGGGASNPAWTKMRLKALGVPERPSLSEHAAVGTARLAWRGIGHAN
jgi:D-ribulokinase